MSRVPSHEELKTVADLRIALRRFMQASDEVTAAHRLTSRQYDLLALLHRPPREPLTPTAVARGLSLSRSATTELLTRALRAGLITREHDALDERTKQIAPTAEGSRRYYAAVADLRAERTRLLELLRLAAGLAATLAAIL